MSHLKDALRWNQIETSTCYRQQGIFASIEIVDAIEFFSSLVLLRLVGFFGKLFQAWLDRIAILGTIIICLQSVTSCIQLMSLQSTIACSHCQQLILSHRKVMFPITIFHWWENSRLQAKIWNREREREREIGLWWKISGGEAIKNTIYMPGFWPHEWLFNALVTLLCRCSSNHQTLSSDTRVFCY